MTANTFDFSDRIARGIPPAPKAAPGGGRVAFDFTTAFPDPDSFPADGLLEALGRALKDEGKDLVYYPHPQGHPAMREFIAQKLERRAGDERFARPDSAHHRLRPGRGAIRGASHGPR